MREILSASSLCQASRICGHHGGQQVALIAEPGKHPRMVSWPGSTRSPADGERASKGRWAGTKPDYASSPAAAASGGACRSRWDLTVTGSGHWIASSGSSNAIETSSDGSCT